MNPELERLSRSVFGQLCRFGNFFLGESLVLLGKRLHDLDVRVRIFEQRCVKVVELVPKLSVRLEKQFVDVLRQG